MREGRRLQSEGQGSDGWEAGSEAPEGEDKVVEVPTQLGPVPAEGTQVGALALGRSHGGGEGLEAKDVMRPWLALAFPLLGVRLPRGGIPWGPWKVRACERTAMMAFEAQCPLKEVLLLLWVQKAKAPILGLLFIQQTYTELCSVLGPEKLKGNNSWPQEAPWLLRRLSCDKLKSRSGWGLDKAEEGVLGPARDGEEPEWATERSWEASSRRNLLEGGCSPAKAWR